VVGPVVDVAPPLAIAAQAGGASPPHLPVVGGRCVPRPPTSRNASPARVGLLVGFGVSGAAPLSNHRAQRLMCCT
jgi:hypothetical protein